MLHMLLDLVVSLFIRVFCQLNDFDTDALELKLLQRMGFLQGDREQEISSIFNKSLEKHLINLHHLKSQNRHILLPIS